MENISLVINDVIKISSDLYRVIKTAEASVWAVMLNTSKLNIVSLSYDALNNLQDNNTFELVAPATTSSICFDKLTATVKRITMQSYKIIKELLSFGDISWIASRAKGGIMKELAMKYHISTMTLYNWLRKYFQNGQTLDAMIPSYEKCGALGKERIYTDKKPGRPGVSKIVINEEVIKQFNSTIRRHKQLRGRESLAKSFDTLCRLYYSKDKDAVTKKAMGMFPEDKLPTLRQFYYYCKKHLSLADKYEMECGRTAALNNIRPLTSDTLKNMKYAGAAFEIDAVDVDYKIFARNDSDQPVGTADFVAIIDRYTKAIVGFSVQLACNRTSTVQEALLNMIEDKHEFGNQIGYPIDNEVWPMAGCLPDTLITDNGADYLSDALMGIIAESGITVSHLPAKMASYKGNIERAFGQFYQLNAGKILGGRKKDSNKLADMNTHHLTIEDLRMVIIEFILYHNSRLLTDWKYAEEILNKEIEEVTPNKLWNHSLTHENMLKRVTDFNKFKFTLMSSGKGRITRAGIEFKNRFYVIEDMSVLLNIMRNAKLDKAKRIKIKYCRYSVNTIYYIDGNHYVFAYLNPQKTANDVFHNLSFDTANEINKILNSHKRQAVYKN